jgi:AbrB family looped-hinge helix DNA binding protein
MAESIGVITRKGQVTIPVEMRRSLGLKEGDRVAFQVDGKVVRIMPLDSWVARTAGIFKSDLPPMTAEELREAAEIAIIEDVMERSQRD